MTEELLRQIHIAEGKITKLQEEREILRQVGERMMKFADIFKDENAKLKEDREELVGIIHGYEMLEDGDIPAGEMCTIISVDELAKLKDAGIKAGTEYLKLKSTLYEIKKLINKKISSTVADCICKQYSGKGKCKEHDGYNNTSGEVEFLKELESLAKHEDKK